MSSFPLFEDLRIEVECGVALLTVDRVSAMNALSTHVLRQLEQAFEAFGEDRALRGLILTGAGERAFVAGADVAEMSTFTTVQGRSFAGLGHRVMHLLENLSIPTIAAVNGFALGGGAELALACDLIYAAENARFGQPEVNLGIIPGFGGTQRLSRRVGIARAKELIFTGELIDAAKAREIGLVLEVLPRERLLPHCREVMSRICRRGPLAVTNAKRVIEYGADADLRAANEMERQAFASLFGSEDQKEGMAAFLEKRSPDFKGR